MDRNKKEREVVGVVEAEGVVDTLRDAVEEALYNLDMVGKDPDLRDIYLGYLEGDAAEIGRQAGIVARRLNEVVEEAHRDDD